MARSKLFRFFPIPEYIVMPSFGLEISERTIKYVEMKDTPEGLIVNHYGIEHIPDGAIGKGIVVDPTKLLPILTTIRKNKKVEAVCVSIPEEQVYTFQQEIELIPGVEIRDSILLNIEGYIPVPADVVEFDYDIISTNGNRIKIQVAAVERTVVESYIEVCNSAGMQVVACEYECQALARALTKPGDTSVVYIIDIGHASTTASVVQNGIVVSSSTIMRGGEEITLAISKALNISNEEAETVKYNIGMNGKDQYIQLPEILSQAYLPLFTEIIDQYNAWLTYVKTRETTYHPIDSIQIVGTEALTPGFIDLLQASFHKTVVLANVWTRVETVSTRVPLINFKDSLIYGTAIGLALGAFEV
jgi:type IV pilus assembly protein PilM